MQYYKVTDTVIIDLENVKYAYYSIPNICICFYDSTEFSTTATKEEFEMLCCELEKIV